ncbi:MAG TPA: chemotaxis protein CheW [Thermoanaerobaculia bacterium]|nr:chemotaxis protein CheW [Thermoanaerobaculia bacterium]
MQSMKPDSRPLSPFVPLVIFRLDGERYALPLAGVERIVRAVEVTPLPSAPAIVLGAINVGGSVLPVLDIRRRFLLPEREIGPDDQFLIARTSSRVVVLVIDEAQEIIEPRQADIIASERIVPGMEQFQGVVKLDDGLVLIHDLETFLSLDDARGLDEAMDRAAS